MAECVAKVQQCTFALLRLVAHHDIGLHLNRPAHSLDPGGHIACGQCRTLNFKPVKERRVAQHAVFHDLAITRQEIAGLKRAKRIGIGQNQRGLVKCADKVLALRGVDPGFAANRTVDLRQQRCRYLHKTNAAAQNRGGKAHQIADNAAAQSDHNVIAFDLLIQQPIHAMGQLCPALCRLTGGQAKGF